MKNNLNNVHGSCLCGSIKFELFGDMERIYLCHCMRCRRSTGTAHASNIFTNPENIKWLSGKDLIQRFELPEAERFMKQFCSRCGSCVPYVNRLGTKLVVPAGSLYEQFAISPEKNIYWESRAKWYETGLKVQKNDKY